MKLFDDKRAYWPSFFMSVALVLVLFLSLFIHNYTVWFLSLSVLVLLSLFYLKKELVLTPLLLLVAVFITLFIININVISPVDNAEANYLISLFTAGFVLSTYANEQFIKNTLSILVCIFILLTILGLIQYLTGYGYLVQLGQAANAIFYTPNTFAASLNIILLPLIIFYIFDNAAKYLLSAILILFAGLLVSQSRGGWVAFLFSMLFIYVLIKIVGINFNRQRIKRLLLGLMLVFSCYVVINQSGLKNENNTILLSENINHLIRSDNVVSTMTRRFEHYNIAWEQIKKTPLAGTGFHTYQYFQLRDQQAPYIGIRTRYVHNDYLQLWMETGISGVVLFIALFILPVYYLIKWIRRIRQNELMVLIAILAGLASFYIHALVDFIFYVPFILFMFGFSLGVFNQYINKHCLAGYVVTLPARLINARFLKPLTCLVIVGFLSQPVIAQLAYNKAIERTQSLDIETALKLYELARRFAPTVPAYYWYEGAVLMNAVKLNQHSPSAVRADKLFAKGMNVGSFTVKNSLARAELHRDYGYLLADREDLNIVLSWNEAALYWRPSDPIVRAEHLKTLVAMRQYEKANTLLDNYLLQTPMSKELLAVKELL